MSKKHIHVFIAYMLSIVAAPVLATSVGTGFFLNSDGYVATNYHVIEGAANLKIRLSAGEVVDAALVGTDVSNDIAILKINKKQNKYIPTVKSDKVMKGDRVFTLGYPNISIQGVELKFTEGSISSLTGIKDQPNTFQISVPVQPGNSGGPLIDSFGNVVGLVVAKLSAKATLQSSGALPENINYAIKSNYLLELASVKKVPIPISSKIKKVESELVLALGDAVVMVIAENDTSSKISKRSNSYQRNVDVTYKVGVLGYERIKSTKSFIESDDAFKKRWGDLLKSFSKTNGIDLVFEKAVYLNNVFEIVPDEVASRKIIDPTRYFNPKIFYVDARKALSDTGSDLKDVNRVFNIFAKKIGADIVVDTAVIASDRVNVTDAFISYYKSGIEPSMDFSKSVSVRFINEQVIFSSKYLKKLTLEYGKDAAMKIFLKHADKAISDFTKSNDIDLLFQSGWDIRSELDVSTEILGLIDQGM